jgi:hypothetical protein
VSASDRFWREDPLRVDVQPSGGCEQCWREVYASVPGHEFCREHFMEFQRKSIAAMAQRVAVTAGLWAPIGVAWMLGLWRV